MKKIDSLLSDINPAEKRVQRFKYMPYSLDLAKSVWYGIAQKLIGKVSKENQITDCWTNLIKWVHGDESCKYNLEKNILLSGRTGSGKSVTMKILHEYIKIDNVKFKRNGKIVPLNFQIYSSRQIVADFQNAGYDGISKYMVSSNICIDDLGTEPPEALHYGTRLNVVSEIIEERYMKGKTTHFTTNLAEDNEDNQILERYNSRVHSRIKETCNVIVLNDKDFRV